MTDAEIVEQLRKFFELKGWPVLRVAADRLEQLNGALLNISLMDCYTREGEEPVHEMIIRQAQEAIK
jgi:hypothetical protein